jgi:hypothetical protein
LNYTQFQYLLLPTNHYYWRKKHSFTFSRIWFFPIKIAYSFFISWKIISKNYRALFHKYSKFFYHFIAKINDRKIVPVCKSLRIARFLFTFVIIFKSEIRSPLNNFSLGTHKMKSFCNFSKLWNLSFLLIIFNYFLHKNIYFSRLFLKFNSLLLSFSSQFFRNFIFFMIM